MDSHRASPKAGHVVTTPRHHYLRLLRAAVGVTVAATATEAGGEEYLIGVGELQHDGLRQHAADYRWHPLPPQGPHLRLGQWLWRQTHVRFRQPRRQDENVAISAQRDPHAC